MSLPRPHCCAAPICTSKPKASSRAGGPGGVTISTHNGSFWHRMDDDGRIRCAFRVEAKHLNGMGKFHGAFMAFADYCLFALASPIRRPSPLYVLKKKQ